MKNSILGSLIVSSIIALSGSAFAANTPVKESVKTPVKLSTNLMKSTTKTVNVTAKPHTKTVLTAKNSNIKTVKPSLSNKVSIHKISSVSHIKKVAFNPTVNKQANKQLTGKTTVVNTKLSKKS